MFEWPAEWFDEIDSTNEEARRRVAAGNFSSCWIVARQQSAGRGRLGRSWKSPSLDGTIQDVSADLKRDPVSGAAFYEARVQIELPNDGSASGLEITPGMPVDVFIFSGKSRTTLDYLMEPIAASIFKGLREG